MAIQRIMGPACRIAMWRLWHGRELRKTEWKNWLDPRCSNKILIQSYSGISLHYISQLGWGEHRFTNISTGCMYTVDLSHF